MLNPTDQPSSAKKVLCIEDEFFISELYQRALTKAGYETTVVLNGTDGLQVAQTNRYDIILLDIMVPGTNGMEIFRTLKDPAKTPELKAKIIVTTNLDLDEKSKEEVESQADGYLIKAAITPKELVAFLDKLKFDEG